MAEKLRRKCDWVGRLVQLRVRVESKGGSIFPAGTIMRVTRNFGGLHLEREEACANCRTRRWTRVKGIPERDVELLPDGSKEAMPPVMLASLRRTFVELLGKATPDVIEQQLRQLRSDLGTCMLQDPETQGLRSWLEIVVDEGYTE